MPKRSKRGKESLQRHFFSFVPVKFECAIEPGLYPLLERGGLDGASSQADVVVISQNTIL